VTCQLLPNSQLTILQNGKALDYEPRDSGLDSQDDEQRLPFGVEIYIMAGEMEMFDLLSELGIVFIQALMDIIRLGPDYSYSRYWYEESSTWFSED